MNFCTLKLCVAANYAQFQNFIVMSEKETCIGPLRFLALFFSGPQSVKKSIYSSSDCDLNNLESALKKQKQLVLKERTNHFVGLHLYSPIYP